MKNSYTIKVAYVEDQALYNEIISDHLNTIEGVCHWGEQFLNGVHLLEYLENHTDNLPDIILMDLSLPGMSGFETTKIVRSLYPSIKIVALSQYDDFDNRSRMKYLGCNAFLNKVIASQNLKEAIYAVYETGTFEHLEFAKRYAREQELYERRKISGLRYLEIVFIQQYSKGKSYKAIADYMNLSPHTMDGYVKRICEKWKLENMQQVLLKAFKMRIIDPDK